MCTFIEPSFSCLEALTSLYVEQYALQRREPYYFRGWSAQLVSVDHAGALPRSLLHLDLSTRREEFVNDWTNWHDYLHVPGSVAAATHLRSLRLKLDVWWEENEERDIGQRFPAWWAPLQQLTGLTSLALEMKCMHRVPSAVRALTGLRELAVAGDLWGWDTARQEEELWRALPHLARLEGLSLPGCLSSDSFSS